MMKVVGVIAALVVLQVWKASATCGRPSSGDLWIEDPVPMNDQHQDGDCVTYECKAGYRIAGQDDDMKTTETLRCVGDQWSGPRPCCEEIDGTLFWMEGPPSDMYDDSPSDAFCPVGYYAVECYCDDETICDGSSFDPDDIRRCTAYKSGGVAGRVKAVTKCEPSKGKEVMTIRKRVSSESEVLTCDAGYNMEACTSFDPWSQSRVRYFVWSVSAEGSSTCGWKSNTDPFNWISITIVCTKAKQ